MKIVVDEMPTKPNKCLFVDERRAFDSEKNPFPLYKCKLSCNDSNCELNYNGCSKLEVFKWEVLDD